MRKRTTLLLLAPLLLAFRATDDAVVRAAATVSPAAPRIDRLDPALDALLAAGSEPVQIAGGFKWTEGPVWLPSNQVLFAEIPSNSIRRWTPGSGVSMFISPSGYKGAEPFRGPEPGSNGMTLDSHARLTVAGHAQRDVWRLEGSSPGDRQTLLADSYQGKRLNSPNDLVYRSDGSLYFTDPTFGLPTQAPGDPAQELNVQGVYRIPRALRQKAGSPPARTELELLVKDLPEPNGIAFSPDEKYLYIDNPLPEMLWMRYRVRPDGSLYEAKVFFDAGPYAKLGAPDGMKVDKSGNVYSAGPGGIWIFSPAGVHLGTIHFDAPVSNLAWGDADSKTLYIAASSALYRIRLRVPGLSQRVRR
jgi:gluconolactonase